MAIARARFNGTKKLPLAFQHLTVRPASGGTTTPTRKHGAHPRERALNALNSQEELVKPFSFPAPQNIADDHDFSSRSLLPQHERSTDVFVESSERLLNCDIKNICTFHIKDGNGPEAITISTPMKDDDLDNRGSTKLAPAKTMRFDPLPAVLIDDGNTIATTSSSANLLRLPLWQKHAKWSMKRGHISLYNDSTPFAAGRRDIASAFDAPAPAILRVTRSHRSSMKM
jgi:hypothetical protein